MTSLNNNFTTSGICIPNLVINSAIKSKSNSLNVCHINTCSLYKKIGQLREIVFGTEIHIICISESWLKTTHSDRMVEIAGFKILRHDRFGSRGGGVAIYVKNGIKCNVIRKSSSTCSLEFVFVELLFNNYKLLIGSVYNPPTKNNFSELDLALSELSNSFKDIIIAGDFNVNMCVTNNSSTNLKNLFLAYAINIVNNEPTHLAPHATRATCLDLFIVSNKCNVSVCSQINVPGISYHDLIFLSYVAPISKVLTKDHYFRNYSRIDYAALELATSSVYWNTIFDLVNIDDKINFLESNINCLFERFVPLTKIKIQTKGNPWHNTELAIANTNRDIAHRVWRRSRLKTDWNVFVNLKKIAIDTEETAKGRYFEPKLSSCLSTKDLWRNIKNLGVKDVISADFNFDVNDLNTYFSSNSHVTVSNNAALIPSHNSPDNGFGYFSFMNIFYDDVLKAISSVKSNAIGLDGISLKFLKLIIPTILPYLHHIFNHVLTTSTFPSSWKCAKIIPLPKVGSPKSLNDYRPISILPAISKCMEIVIKKQINNHITLNNLLSEKQSGFRSSHSTTTSLLKITDDIRLELDKNHISVLLFLDFTKAFDTVNHKKLCCKLGNLFKFSTTAVKLISSYLSNRTQIVTVNDVCSNIISLNCGVPQGSVLGPLLFSLYINDLPNIVINSDCSLFADDVQLRLSGNLKKGPDIIKSVNIDLDKIKKWSEDNGLRLNPSKTKAIYISRKQINSSNWPVLCLDGVTIQPSNKVKNLGLIFNNKFSWTDHVNAICGKVYGGLRRLYHLNKLLPQFLRLRLVKSLLIPFFTYGDVVLTSLSFESKRKLSVAFNGCIRFIYKLKRYDSLSLYSASILGCSLYNYFDYRTCLTMYRLICTKTPNYLYQKLKFSTSKRTLNLIVSQRRLFSMDYAFFIRGIKLWNSLPVLMKRINSDNVFKKACLRHFCNI